MASQDEMRRRRMDRFGSGDGGGGGGGGGGRGDGVGGPVTTQPTEGMQGPPQGAQLGLSRMTDAEYLFVQQDVEHFEALTGFETENRCDSSLSLKVSYLSSPSRNAQVTLNAKSGRFALHAHGSKGRGRMLCTSQRFTREGSVPSYPHFQNNSSFPQLQNVQPARATDLLRKRDIFCAMPLRMQEQPLVHHARDEPGSIGFHDHREVRPSLHVVKGRGERSRTAVCAHTRAP